MTEIEKPTRCGNTEQAKTENPQGHFTGTIKRIKLEFIRLAVWWRIAWGVLL